MQCEFLKTDEVAELLGVSRSRAIQMVAGGLLPSVRRGRTYLIPVRAWDKWLAEQNRIAMNSMKEARLAETV